jgi:putative transposase
VPHNWPISHEIARRSLYLGVPSLAVPSRILANLQAPKGSEGNRCVSHVKQLIKQWTKPLTTSLVTSALSDTTRSRVDLIAENALLRQQLIVLRRQIKRPQLTKVDRIRLVLLARCTQFWRQALHIVQPDTLLRWHRDLFRRYWRRKSWNKKPKPRIASETIALIKQMAKRNPLWGAERIRGELLKLGIRVSKRTIQKYMAKVHRTSGQTWITFLKNHAGDIWACDFTVVHTLFFLPLYIFVIMELKTRRVVHTAITSSPTDVWTAQQLREATPWGEAPKYLIHDRDSKYGRQFSAVAASSGIKELKTPFRAPKANAYCERFIGSLKRECLDHILILHRNQLYRLVTEFIHYYNLSRPHQGIDQRIPARFDQNYHRQSGRIASTPVLGGLHHSYARVPHLN